MDLMQAVKKKRKETVADISHEIDQIIEVDVCPMTIAQTIELYEDGWLKFPMESGYDVRQKSEVIASVLLGALLPGVLVWERKDAGWKALSEFWGLLAILEFVGTFKGEPLVLRGTERLPELEGACWESFPEELKALFKEQTVYFIRGRAKGDKEVQTEKSVGKRCPERADKREDKSLAPANVASSTKKVSKNTMSIWAKE